MAGYLRGNEYSSDEIEDIREDSLFRWSGDDQHVSDTQQRN